MVEILDNFLEISFSILFNFSFLVFYLFVYWLALVSHILQQYVLQFLCPSYKLIIACIIYPRQTFPWRMYILLTDISPNGHFPTGHFYWRNYWITSSNTLLVLKIVDVDNKYNYNYKVRSTENLKSKYILYKVVGLSIHYRLF